MLAANKTGYFPYTPAMPMLHGLRVAVDRLLHEGLDQVFARHQRLAEGVRRAIKDGWNLALCAQQPHWESQYCQHHHAA